MRWANQAEAQIVLGDRPVEVTLQRAWEALSFGERLDLARSLAQLAFQRAGGGGGGGSGGGDDGSSEAAEVRGVFGSDVVAGLRWVTHLVAVFFFARTGGAGAA